MEPEYDQRSGPDEARNDLTQRRHEIFLTFLYSRIDNTRLNFRLAIPELLQVEKF